MWVQLNVLITLKDIGLVPDNEDLVAIYFTYEGEYMAIMNGYMALTVDEYKASKLSGESDTEMLRQIRILSSVIV
jgi:hypothetical protein